MILRLRTNKTPITYIKEKVEKNWNRHAKVFKMQTISTKLGLGPLEREIRSIDFLELLVFLLPTDVLLFVLLSLLNC